MESSETKTTTTTTTTTKDQIAMRVDRVLSNSNVLELANANASLEHYGFNAAATSSYSVPVSKEAVRVGWASTCLIIALMKKYNLSDATEIQSKVAAMDCDACSLVGIQESLQQIQNMVDVQQDIKVTTPTQQESEDTSALHLGSRAATAGAAAAVVAAADHLTALVKGVEILFNERRILAFEQTQPEKVLHNILLHFQMIVKSKTLKDVVPRMQEIMTRLVLDRTALNSLRSVFGLTQVGEDVNVTEQDNKELVNIVTAYAVKEGLTPFDRFKQEKKREKEGEEKVEMKKKSGGATFVPSRNVRRVTRRKGQF